MDVCHTCIEKAEANIAAAAATKATAPASAGGGGSVSMEPAAAAFVAAATSTTTVSPPATNNAADPMVIDITGKTETGVTAVHVPGAVGGKKKAVWASTLSSHKKKSGPNKKQALLTSAKAKVVHRKDKDMKGPPKAGTVLYTVKEKLGMAKIWKETANGTGRKSALAKKWCVSSRAVERWVKDEVKLEKQVAAGRRATKTMISDPLRRIVHGLNQFYEANARMPRDLKLPLTGEFV
jgi:hypothetical protein